jgi:hypothetical protein
MLGRTVTKTRRSGHVTLRVPLKLFEPGSNRRFLVEEASALKVSLWGGLIAISAAVNLNQKLLLANQATGETAESMVVYLGPMQLGGRRLRLVAIEFLRPSPGFGGMVFPTPDPWRSQTGGNGNQNSRARTAP